MREKEGWRTPPPPPLPRGTFCCSELLPGNGFRFSSILLAFLAVRRVMRQLGLRAMSEERADLQHGAVG